MKKINKLVLNQIAKKELTQRQQGLVKGGRKSCTCGCCYAGVVGAAGVEENAMANCDGDLHTVCPDIVFSGC